MSVFAHNLLKDQASDTRAQLGNPGLLSPIRKSAGRTRLTSGLPVVAEAITLKDAVILVRSRGEKMEQLYPVGYGLAAIVGLNERQVTAIVDSVHTAAAPVFVGNINAPRQIIIAGTIEGMQKRRDAEGFRKGAPTRCQKG